MASFKTTTIESRISSGVPITNGTLEAIANSNEYKATHLNVLSVFEENRKEGKHPFTGDIRESQLRNIIESHKTSGEMWKTSFKWEERVFFGNRLTTLKHQFQKLPSGFDENYHLPIIESYIQYRDTFHKEMISTIIQPYFDKNDIKFKLLGWGYHKLAEKKLNEELGRTDMLLDVMKIWILKYFSDNNMIFNRSVFLPFYTPTKTQSHGTSIQWKTIKPDKK